MSRRSASWVWMTPPPLSILSARSISGRRSTHSAADLVVFVWSGESAVMEAPREREKVVPHTVHLSPFRVDSRVPSFLQSGQAQRRSLIAIVGHRSQGFRSAQSFPKRSCILSFQTLQTASHMIRRDIFDSPRRSEEHTSEL